MREMMNKKSAGLWITLLMAIISNLLDGNWETFAAANIVIMILGESK